jgi:hypothetical protein
MHRPKNMTFTYFSYASALSLQIQGMGDLTLPPVESRRR